GRARRLRHDADLEAPPRPREPDVHARQHRDRRDRGDRQAARPVPGSHAGGAAVLRQVPVLRPGDGVHVRAAPLIAALAIGCHGGAGRPRAIDAHGPDTPPPPPALMLIYRGAPFTLGPTSQTTVTLTDTGGVAHDVTYKPSLSTSQSPDLWTSLQDGTALPF